VLAQLSELLERQAQRRAEREEEGQTMEEMRKRQEDQRKQDDEERKAKQEAEKRKKEADRKRKQAMMAGGGIGGMMSKGDGKPNYVLPNKENQEEKKAGPKITPGMSKEDVDAQKQTYLARFLEPFDGTDMEVSELRMRVKGMHEELVRLESAKYDMEERQKIQEYDLKELRERAKQQARQQAIKKGLDPEEAANAKHPAKKAVASKYDRQIDRRTYGDRTVMFKDSLKIDGKPMIAPPKAIFHGSCRPPAEFGRPASKIEELEVLRKTMEPPKYQEAAPVEGAKPPVKAIKSANCPGEDEVGPAPPSLDGMAAAYVPGAAKPVPTVSEPVAEPAPAVAPKK
jgi:troponin T